MVNYTNDICRSDNCPGNRGIFDPAPPVADITSDFVIGGMGVGIVSASGLNSTVFLIGVFRLMTSGIGAVAVGCNAGLGTGTLYPDATPRTAFMT